MEKKKLCVSFSGGRTSAFLAKWCLKNLSGEFDIVCVFANTGKERPETLDFIHKCDRYFGLNLVWVEAITNPAHGKGTRAKIVNFETASRNGEPFEAFIRKHGMPNQGTPHCTRELKEYPIKSYLKNQLGWRSFYTAIGIRADEPRRLDWKKAIRKKIIYPLATHIHTTKENINSFWMKMPFDLQLKSYEGNCDLCWKKSQRKLMTIAMENPKLLDWWSSMESKYENFVPITRVHNPNIKLPIRFFRNNQSVSDIIEEASFSFELARDESFDVNNQMMFWDEHLDGNFGCTESCEVF